MKIYTHSLSHAYFFSKKNGKSNPMFFALIYLDLVILYSFVGIYVPLFRIIGASLPKVFFPIGIGILYIIINIINRKLEKRVQIDESLTEKTHGIYMLFYFMIVFAFSMFLIKFFQ